MTKMTKVMTMKHRKFVVVHKLMGSGKFPVLLEGPSGSGKTTLLMQVAEELNLKFQSLGMTRQTTMSHLLGFVGLSGEYVRTAFREVVEFGGVFLLDEIDAADANVLLCINTLDNGFVVFPDKRVYAHKDFRLCATANPAEDHARYTGRSRLDHATLERFHLLFVTRSEEVEKSLLSEKVLGIVSDLRATMEQFHVVNEVSMRIGMKIQDMYDLGLDLDGVLEQHLSEEGMESFKKKQELRKPQKASEQYASEDPVKTLWEAYKLRQDEPDPFNPH